MNQIMKRAVERGLLRREPDNVVHVGMDEKSFRTGHKYITILNDLDKGRVLDVVEDRTIKATRTLLGTLSKQQRKAVKPVSIDMWQAFATATHKLLPAADIVHDRLHISKYLNDAVNKVRNQESNELMKNENTSLVGSKPAKNKNVNGDWRVSKLRKLSNKSPFLL